MYLFTVVTRPVNNLKLPKRTPRYYLALIHSTMQVAPKKVHDVQFKRSTLQEQLINIAIPAYVSKYHHPSARHIALLRNLETILV